MERRARDVHRPEANVFKGQMRGNHSFAEVLKGSKTELRDKKVETKANQKEEDIATLILNRGVFDCRWLRRCAIGVLKNFSSIARVNKRLLDRGFCFTTKYLGGKSILWSFESDCDCVGFIKNSFFWNDTFSSIDIWLDAIPVQAKPVWINISGIPLQFWNEAFFMKEDRMSTNRLKVRDGNSFFEISLEKEAVPVNLAWIEEELGLNFESVPEGVSFSSDKDDDWQSKGGDRREKQCIEEWEKARFRKGVREEIVKDTKDRPSMLRADGFDEDTRDKGKYTYVRNSKRKPAKGSYLNGKLILEKNNGAGDRGNRENGWTTSSDSGSEEGQLMDSSKWRGECSNRKQVVIGPKVGKLDGPQKTCFSSGPIRGSETNLSSSEDRAISTASPSSLEELEQRKKDQIGSAKKILLRHKDQMIFAFSDQEGRNVSLPLRGPIQLPLNDLEGGKIRGDDLVEIPLAMELGRDKEKAPNQKKNMQGSVEFRGRDCETPSMKMVRDAKLKHECGVELVNHVCMQLYSMNFQEMKDFLQNPRIMSSAVTSGIEEIVRILLLHFPDLMDGFVSKEYPRNILQAAIEYRQEKIFNIIKETYPSQTKNLSTYEVESGNTTLHLAGKLAPPFKLFSVSGAALQIQRELQWFKEVENITFSYQREQKNSNNETAKDVFRTEHKKLAEQGEKWMKDTANSCMLVSTLIATVLFAAAFTVPGGNFNDNEIPIFLRTNAFTVFSISNALGLFSSLNSLLMFLAILTARYEIDDFLKSLPKKLIIGLGSLFVAIAAMIIAFGATLTIVLSERWNWVFVPITSVASLPVAIFVMLQLPLFVQMVQSTYGASMFCPWPSRV
ncbi:hypothetical protein LWI29_012254 [Acer saccharum]|uniref:PGG domain-containing protein n=1 Tax=Acer saccharum TaxID=4024 RepID=A0AA39SSP0_ACESA|nr:hypothetical protein LWI29_012254 [Acer saccharum]